MARKYRKNALPAETVRQRHAHRSSGAAGVHADQKTRRVRAGKRNRIGSRSAQKRSAIKYDCA